MLSEPPLYRHMDGPLSYDWGPLEFTWTGVWGCNTRLLLQQECVHKYIYNMLDLGILFLRLAPTFF